MPMDPRLSSKMDALEAQSAELSQALAEPNVTSDMDRFRTLSRSYSDVEPILGKFHEYHKVEAELQGAKELHSSEEDAEMRAMAAEEIKQLEEQLETIEADLTVMLLPSDPADAKNVVLEIRAGPGFEDRPGGAIGQGEGADQVEIEGIDDAVRDGGAVVAEGTLDLPDGDAVFEINAGEAVALLYHAELTTDDRDGGGRLIGCDRPDGGPVDRIVFGEVGPDGCEEAAVGDGGSPAGHLRQAVEEEL